MITLKERISVNKPVETVFRYVSDFSFIEDWDPGVVEARKITPGKVGVGTEYHLKLQYGFIPVSMTYRVTEFEAPSRIVLAGRGGSFSAVDTIRFSSHDGGTRIEYQADLQFQGAMESLSPFFTGFFRAIGKKAMEGLKKALNSDFPALTTHPLDCVIDKTIIGGLPGFTKWGFRKHRKRWNPMVVSMEGKTVVITGATSGIGQAAATRLAHLGARVVMVARDGEKAEKTRKQITAATGNDNLGIYLADMGSGRNVISAAKELSRQEARIDILINNAGALFNERMHTEEGFEKTFATDLLGPFILTQGLIRKIAASAPARIVNVASGGMYTQKIKVNDLQYASEPFNGAKAYARAKRGLVILSEMWADRLKPLNIVVHSMHPGWVRTPGIEQALPGFYRSMERMLRTPEQGADTIVWLAAASEAAKTSGQFWLDRRPHPTHVFPHTRETEADRIALWRALETCYKEV